MVVTLFLWFLLLVLSIKSRLEPRVRQANNGLRTLPWTSVRR